jgi:hypothetical protein
MNKLQKTLTRKGVYYSQVKRTSKAALYSLRYEPGGRIIGYDAFKVCQRGERVLKGKTLARGEQFPADKNYGSKAFSYSTMEAAERKFDELEKGD